ncbi:MAG: YjbH domain-containing protein [Bacteroidota bacterium]
MFLRFPLLFTALVLMLCSLHSQPLPSGNDEDVLRQVVAKGYENVRLIQRNDTLFIGLENRVWRWEPRAAAEVFKLVMPHVDSSGVVSLTFLYTGIPVTTVIVSRKQYNNLLAGRLTCAGFSDSVVALLSDRGYRSSVGHKHAVNPSFNKFDVVVSPQLKFQFGNFVHPLELQFNVAPAVQISFLKGMSFTGQIILPVYNNLIGDPEGNTIRPGLVVLSQSFRLPYQFFTTVSAGYFTRSRYGLNGEVRKYLFNGKMAVGATLGYTGQMKLLEGKFNYTPVDAFTWFADASWRFARYDLTIHAGFGGFIDGDQGWRVDIRRQFGEVSIGFFAMQTGTVTNGGFNFIVPLPPRRYGTKNIIRIRPASYVPWEYRAKGLPSYGRTFTTGTGPEEMMLNMHPDYIRTQLGKQIIVH